MQAKQQYRILIGIDPGVNTGFAVYEPSTKKLLQLRTISLIKAMDLVKSEWTEEICLGKLLVRIEDARKRNWFGKKGPEALQGAGSIKRDCSVWEEFCQLYSIPFEFVAPKNNNTKMDESVFRKLTGWNAKSSTHSRDAAMLVFGY